MCGVSEVACGVSEVMHGLTVSRYNYRNEWLNYHISREFKKEARAEGGGATDVGRQPFPDIQLRC